MKIPTMLRLLLSAALIVGVYLETGVFTTIFAVVSLIAVEMQGM